jgi:hypothetical protein
MLNERIGLLITVNSLSRTLTKAGQTFLIHETGNMITKTIVTMNRISFFIGYHNNINTLY